MRTVLVPSRVAAAWRAVVSRPLLLALVLVTSTASGGVDQSAHLTAPRDTPYQGTITIAVDATDTAQGIFRVHETIPVRPGPFTLLYPAWIPGEHSAAGPIKNLAGLTIRANGKWLHWVRDEYDVYAFHMDVPQGVSKLDVGFQFLSGRRKSSFIQMTDRLLSLEWNEVSLYPAGHFSRDITFKPSVTLPAGWKFGTALETASRSGNTTAFEKTTYNTLVDSPIYAGKYVKRLDLAPGARAPVHLDLFADAPKDLETTPHQRKVLRALVTQTVKLFDSHHYKHYDFLLSLSDRLSGNGLEHHQSSEDGWPADYFANWKHNAPNRDLLAHEFEHSWNGKFMRPENLWTPNFNVPMGDSLLWVYEGLTQYNGFVLTTRSGMWTPEQFRQGLAMVAANYQRNRPGFQWRSMEDTTNDPSAAHRGMLPYRSWQMSEEYYSAGQMMWLAVDAKIRSLTHDKKSLDDFDRKFFGLDDGSVITRTYTRGDVVQALNAVVKYDWAGFFERYVNQLDPPLLSGLEATGWRLVYTDQESEYEKQYEAEHESLRHIFNFAWSIGMTLAKDATINDVRWDGPAYKAGVSTGGTLVAVNGHKYTKEIFKHAIAAAKHGKAPIELLIEYQGHFKTIPVDYHGGLQYPHLVRVKGRPDYLDQIVAPLE